MWGAAGPVEACAATFKRLMGFMGWFCGVSRFGLWVERSFDGLTALGLKSGDFRGCWDLVCFLDLGACVVRTFSALNPEPSSLTPHVKLQRYTTLGRVPAPQAPTKDMGFSTTPSCTALP